MTQINLLQRSYTQPCSEPTLLQMTVIILMLDLNTVKPRSYKFVKP